jgi:hypothetical protein
MGEQSKRVDMVGKKVGFLTGVRFAGIGRRGLARWIFVCDCGTEHEANGADVRSGVTLSCPQCARERIRVSTVTHGMSSTAEYRIWKGMRARCYNKEEAGFANYGGRGITVCAKWLDSFETFISDMGMRPSGKHSIDRKNNNGNYEPGNCRWATKAQQNSNTRRTYRILFGGTEKTMAELSKETGIAVTTLYARYAKGRRGDSLISSAIGRWA